jgi:hypothetical protein
VLGHAAVGGLLLALAWARLQSPDLRRPFETDELITVGDYTWVGVRPSGERQVLNHIHDYYALPPPTARQLGLGAYCSLGRWPEPNNHVLNSLLMNASVALFGRDEWAARLPALLGGVAFTAALYYLCAAVLHWRWAAPLAAVWAWSAPYVVGFSQTARGYTWMLALQVGMIILAYRMARTGRSLALAALAVGAAVLSLMNVVSTAVDWLVPYYAALLIARPGRPGAAGGRWRRYVVAQALAVAGVGGIFFVSHLPSLYSSAELYGLKFDSPGQLLQLAGEVFDELFPGPAAKALAVFGAAGLLTLIAGRRDRFLFALVVLLFVVNLAHFLLTGKLPYARTMGYFIPVLLLGAAYLVETAVGLYETSLPRAGLIGLLALTTVFAAASGKERRLRSLNLAESLRLAARAEPAPDSYVYVPIRSGTDFLVGLYGPRGWRRIDAVRPGLRLNVYMFTNVLDQQTQVRGLPAEGLVMTQYAGETRALDEDGPLPQGAWVFWYPELMRLGLDAKSQDDYVRESGCLALPQFARYQIKLDVYSFLQCYIFLPEGDAPSRKAADVVREALRRFGGRAVVFVPAATR